MRAARQDQQERPERAVVGPAFARLNMRRRALEARLAKLAGVELAEINLFVKRDLIAPQTGGKDSSKALDAPGWVFVLSALEARIALYGGGPTGPTGPTPTGRPGAQSLEPRAATHPGALPTAAQKKLIAQLLTRINMTEYDLGTWAMNHMKWRSRVIGTRWQAARAIEALKSMVVTELRLFERAAELFRQDQQDQLDPPLAEAERRLCAEFGRVTKPAALKPGAVLWMADLVARRGMPLADRQDKQDRQDGDNQPVAAYITCDSLVTANSDKGNITSSGAHA